LRRRVSVALAALLAGVLFVGLRVPASAYYFIPCQSNGAPCPWRNPNMIYVGVYGQGVPPYMMTAIGDAINGWDEVTSFHFVWEDRSDYNANIIVVPYWQNAASLNNGNPWSMLGGCNRYNGTWCTHGEVDINFDTSTAQAATYSSVNRDSESWIRPVQTMDVEQEIGHAVALDHSCARGQQIMSGPNSTHGCGQYNACGGDSQPQCPTTPQPDDIKGVGALYPGGNSNGSSGCADVRPLNRILPPPPSTPVQLPTPPPLPTAPALPSLPPVPTPVPSLSPVPLPTPIPSLAPAVSLDQVPVLPPGLGTDPTSSYVYQNGTDEVQSGDEANLGEAEAYNQAATANGLYPGGQRVYVAPVGTDNLPSVMDADVSLDTTVPTVVNRPC